MNRVFAIASIAVRSAVRSRVVLVLLGLLLLVIVGLPLTVKGDGTVAGQVQILLTYTLGAVSLILSIATVWAGCAAVSLDVQGRQIHLILTKPVRRGEVWLGKWVGLLVLNVALLAVSGAVIYGLLRWNTRGLDANDQRKLREEILVARRQVLAPPVNVEPEARQELERRRAQGALTNGVPVEEVFQSLKDQLLAMAYMVPTGYKRPWMFQLPTTPAGDRPVVVRFKFSSSQVKDAKVTGIWFVGPQGSTDRYEVRLANVPGGTHSFEVPVAALRGSRAVVVEYANVNQEPVAVLFDPKDGVEMLVFEGTFTGNFVRALLVTIFQLALLGALAVSAGSLFSFPVAALVSGYALVMVQAGEYIGQLARGTGSLLSDAGPAGNQATVVDWAMRLVLRVESAIVQPLLGPSPLDALASGRLVDWGWVGWELLIKVVIYSGGLALVASWLFNRREIGLPAE